MLKADASFHGHLPRSLRLIPVRGRFLNGAGKEKKGQHGKVTGACVLPPPITTLSFAEVDNGAYVAAPEST